MKIKPLNQFSDKINSLKVMKVLRLMKDHSCFRKLFFFFIHNKVLYLFDKVSLIFFFFLLLLPLLILILLWSVLCYNIYNVLISKKLKKKNKKKKVLWRYGWFLSTIKIRLLVASWKPFILWYVLKDQYCKAAMICINNSGTEAILN